MEMDDIGLLDQLKPITRFHADPSSLLPRRRGPNRAERTEVQDPSSGSPWRSFVTPSLSLQPTNA